MKLLRKKREALSVYGLKYISISVLSNLIDLICYFQRFINKAIQKSIRFFCLRLTHKVNFLEVVNPSSNEVRRYLRSDLSIEETFREFVERDVTYCILRWFEDLPRWKEGEDIDLLISSSDVEKVRDLFCFNTKNQMFDLYSVDGHLEYRKMPYYSYELTNKLLSEAKSYRDVYRVPSHENYYYSLMYHVVFHKGENAGIPFCDKTEKSVVRSDHDYCSIIGELCGAGENQVPCTYMDMLNRLYEANWMPPVDLAYKYAIGNKFLEKALHLENYYGYEKNWDGELMVFVLRDWAHLNGKVQFIISWFKEHDRDIELIRYHALDESERELCRSRIRGGNWGSGPYPVSGGGPHSFLIFYDYSTSIQRGSIPADQYTANPLYRLKFEIRDIVQAGELPFHNANFIHSSDNEKEAVSFLDCLGESAKAEVFEKLSEISGAFRTDVPVKHTFNSNQSRAKIELIKYELGTAVRKTFRPSKREYLERELIAYNELSLNNPYIPKLLSHNESWFVTEFIDDQLAGLSYRGKVKVLRQHGEQVLDFLRILHRQGYYLIDFHVDNVLLDKNSKIWVFDYEYLHPYHSTVRFEESYNIAGTPADLEVELPWGYSHPGYTYNNYWHKIFKLQ